MKRFLIAILALTVSSCATRTVEVVKIHNDGTRGSSVEKLNCRFGRYSFRMPKEQCADLSVIELWPSFARAKEGEDGFFLTPDGMYCKFKGHKDGTVIICNYSAQPYDYKGTTVPSMDYAVKR